MFNDKASAEDPLGFNDIDPEFIKVFISNVLENKDFKVKDDDDFEEVVNIMLQSLMNLKKSGDADEVEKRSIMNAFASAVATLVIDHTDSTKFSSEKQTAIVVDAMRDAYSATGKTPSETLIKDIEFMVGILIYLDNNDSDSSDSSHLDSDSSKSDAKPSTAPPEPDSTTPTTQKPEEKPSAPVVPDSSASSDPPPSDTSRSLPSSDSSSSPSSGSSSSSSPSDSSGSPSDSSGSPSDSSSSPSDSSKSISSSSSTDLEDSAPNASANSGTDPTPGPGHQFPQNAPDYPTGTVKPISSDGTGPVGPIGPVGKLGPLNDIGPVGDIGPKGPLKKYPQSPSGNIIITHEDKDKSRPQSQPAKSATNSVPKDESKGPEQQDKSTPPPVETTSPETQGSIPTTSEPITNVQSSPTAGPGHQTSVIPTATTKPFSVTSTVSQAPEVTSTLPDQTSEYVPTNKGSSSTVPATTKVSNDLSATDPEKPKSASTLSTTTNHPSHVRSLQPGKPSKLPKPSRKPIHRMMPPTPASEKTPKEPGSSKDPIQESASGIPQKANSPQNPSEKPVHRMMPPTNASKTTQKASESSNAPAQESANEIPKKSDSNSLGGTSPSENKPGEDEVFQDPTPDNTAEETDTETDPEELHTTSTTPASTVKQSQDSPQKPSKKPTHRLMQPASKTTPKASESSNAPAQKYASEIPQESDSNSLKGTSPSEDESSGHEVLQDPEPEISTSIEPKPDDYAEGANPTTTLPKTTASPSQDSLQKQGKKPLNSKAVPVTSTTSKGDESSDELKPTVTPSGVTTSLTQDTNTKSPESNTASNKDSADGTSQASEEVPKEELLSEPDINESLKAASPNESSDETSTQSKKDKKLGPHGNFPQQPQRSFGKPYQYFKSNGASQGPQGAGTFKKNPGPLVPSETASPESSSETSSSLSSSKTGPISSYPESSSKKPILSENPFLSLADFQKIFNASLTSGNKRIPSYVNTILHWKSGKPGELNYRRLVKDLSGMFGALRYDNRLPFSHLYVEMLMEVLYGTFEIIRGSDKSCLHRPEDNPPINKYVNALYDVLI